MKKLWLFDIDGTLVNINQLHLAAHRSTYREILGIDLPDQIIISIFGMPAREALEDLFKKLNISNAGKKRLNNKLELIIEKYYACLDEYLNSGSVLPLPGVIKFLDHLAKSEMNVLGVISGNREDIGKKILQKAGILSYFSILSFDCGKGKSQIVENALKQAPSSQQVIIVGDTISDIKAGKENDALVVAVASGSCTLSELEKASPNLFISSLEDYQKIIEKIEIIFKKMKS